MRAKCADPAASNFWAAIKAQGLYLTLLVETHPRLKAQNLSEDLLVHVSVRELPVTNNG